MKRLSKNNKLGIEKSFGELHQHYSFRKLSSGLLVSAAIGSFLFIGTNTVQAASLEEEVSNSTVGDSKNSGNVSDLNSETIQKKEISSSTDQNKASVVSDKGSTADVLEHHEQRDLKSDAASQLAKDNNGNTISSDNTSQATELKSENVTDSQKKKNVSPDKSSETLDLTEKSNMSVGLLESKLKRARGAEPRGEGSRKSAETTVSSQDGRNNLTIDNNQTGSVEGNNNIQLKLQTSGAGQYEVSIPNSDVYTITSADLDPAYGVKTQTEVNGNSIYKYNITYDGVINIPITITTDSNYKKKSTPMPSIGTTEKTINWSINGDRQDPLTFYQTIKPEWYPVQPTRTNPDPTQVEGVQVGTNVTYTLKLNEAPGINRGLSDATGRVNSAVNYGTIITVPVPDGFKLDEAATMAKNNFGDQTTITQTGGTGTNIVITVPKGSGNQAYQTTGGYQLVGKYDIAQPENDLQVSTNQQITIVQRLADGESSQIKEATVPSFTDKIIGKNTSIPIGNIFMSAGTAYYNKKIPVTKDDIVVGYFGLQNSTIFAYDDNNKLDIKLTFPDGLTVNKITAPANAVNLPGTTGYTYKMTLKNGQILTGEVTAGQSVITDNSIQTITFNPNLWAIGAKTDNLPANFIYSQDTTVSTFIAYGHVNESYDSGSAINTGDQFMSTLDVRAGNLGGSATATQSVVLPQDEVANESVFNYQASSISGTKRAGYLSVYRGSNQMASTTDQIFEPVFYYVLPSSTVPESPLQLVTPNSSTVHPEITEFAADGRTVVKVDYTETGYNFNTTLSANNMIWLDNQSDATNSILPWDIYVISPRTKMSNPKYSDSTESNFSTSSATNPFNPNWVENNTANLYYIGGGYWHIQQIAGVTSQVMAKGNENGDFSPTGSSDDKKSPNMQIGVSIINGTEEALNNATAYISVPDTTTGSGFNFQLTGESTLERLPYSTVSDYTITYSTLTHDIYNSEPNGDFVTADQVADWSKIKTIKISIPHIDGKNVLGRLILSGQDKNIAEDAGKIGYVKTILYAPGFANYNNSGNPVTISIKGNSTVTSRYSYTDDSGNVQTINIPDRTYTYQDNSSYMLSKDDALNNLTVTDKALIPDGYVLDGTVELLPPTKKSWQTDAPIDTPEFGEQVKYFYNNAIIQYNLVKKYTADVQTKEVTRTINYVDKTTEQPMPSDLIQTITQTVTFTQYQVKDRNGNMIGYNTSGTWNDDTYIPSTESNGQIKIDTTDIDESWINSADIKWDTVTNPNLKRNGYSGPFESDGSTDFTSVVGESPTALTANKTINVYYTEDTVEVTSGEPKQSGDDIAGTDEKYPSGVAENDLNKTVTRIIHVYNPDNQSVNTETQDVKYTRTATINIVTKVVTYSDWVSTNNKWSEYLPTLDAGESIRSITDMNDNAYPDVKANSEGKLLGIAEKEIPSTATNNDNIIVNIRLEKTVSFTGQRTITYETYDRNDQLVSVDTDDSQTVTVSGIKYYDPSTNKVAYEFDEPDKTYASVNVPVKAGYYASSKIVPQKNSSN